MSNSMNTKGLSRFIQENDAYGLYLNEIGKIPAASLERSRLSHGHGYGSAGDRPPLFARFSLNFNPFMKYPG